MVAPECEARGAGRFYFYGADSINYAVSEDHSKTLSIRGREEASNRARSRWGHQLKIPVLRASELDSVLGPHSEREIVEPSSDEAEQYDLFLRNQLAFEDWRSYLGSEGDATV